MANETAQGARHDGFERGHRSIYRQRSIVDPTEIGCQVGSHPGTDFWRSSGGASGQRYVSGALRRRSPGVAGATHGRWEHHLFGAPVPRIRGRRNALQGPRRHRRAGPQGSALCPRVAECRRENDRLSGNDRTRGSGNDRGSAVPFDWLFGGGQDRSLDAATHGSLVVCIVGQHELGLYEIQGGHESGVGAQRCDAPPAAAARCESSSQQE
mmetsp:Transcript_25770/g.55085  ORF Transcript_25770/g.55085 Transcript_25770/m.55085 type:complete len:211 (-) Transcript_25770:550-1182(-)